VKFKTKEKQMKTLFTIIAAWQEIGNFTSREFTRFGSALVTVLWLTVTLPFALIAAPFVAWHLRGTIRQSAEYKMSVYKLNQWAKVNGAE
jgi:hypothetical protein